MNNRSHHFSTMALYGSPFLQSTLIFLSTTNLCHRFFTSHLLFLTQCSPVSGKHVACTIDFSVTLNFNNLTLTRPPLNVLVNFTTTAMSNLSKFYRNGRNLDSCNSARLFLYFSVCSISCKDNGSLLMGAISNCTSLLGLHHRKNFCK